MYLDELGKGSFSKESVMLHRWKLPSDEELALEKQDFNLLTVMS